MRFLANENFPGPAVAALRQAGHDVAWMREIGPGTADPRVLALAIAETRILITFDEDFGELAFRHRSISDCGVVLFRIAPISAAEIARLAVAVLGAGDSWPGHFSVVEEHRVRMTPLPPRLVNGTP